MNRKAFDALLPSFSMVYEQEMLQHPRQRAVGGGRKARLRTAQDKLFYILCYFKSYPTFDLAGLLFDLDRAQAHYWMYRLQPILEAALGEKLALPERKLTSVEAFIERFPGVQRIMVDGTEHCPSTRPGSTKAE